jgi:Family of unknown function (DUF6535)
MVSVLLSVSISDLKPNPQDTSAFYLENIYQLQVFENTNISRPSIPPALAKPPAFSPSRYAIWVNSLWFLSLLVSLWAAMGAMLFRDWKFIHSSLTRPQWSDETSEKHARRIAIFSEGMFGPYIRWEVGHDTIYLHFALLLFIAGSLIYLFNINRTVFYAVVWWVGYMTISYAGATASVFVKPHDLFATPLSSLALRIYLSISYVVSQVCSYLPPLHGFRDNITRHHRDLRDRYGKGFLLGKLKVADEAASKPSREIDGMILDSIMAYLDEDHKLEAFFNAIPGLKLSDSFLPSRTRKKLRQSLDGFLNRTFSSSLISESDRTGRLITCLNAAYAALYPRDVSEILDNIFNGHWDKALQFVEKWDPLRLWGLSQNRDLTVRKLVVACIIPRVCERDDRWIKLVKETFCVPERVFLDYLAYGDSALLSVLIYISRETNRDCSWSPQILSSLSKFDIHKTLSELQNDFCTMWNDTVRDTHSRLFTPVRILRDIRHLYIALHQSTNAARIAFSPSSDSLDSILTRPLSYPLCNVASHRPDSSPRFPVPHLTTPTDSLDAQPHHSTYSGSTALRQVKGAAIIAGAPFPMSLGEIRDSFPIPAVTSPASLVPASSHPSDASPGTVAVTQGVSPAAALSHPPKGTAQRDIVTPCIEPDIGEVSLVSYAAGTASTLNPLLPTSSVVDFLTSASPPQPCVPPLPNVEFLALLSSATVTAAPNHPTSNATRPRPRVRGLVNSGSMCFANATLQLLVHSPPFWDLFRELGDLNVQLGAGDLGTGSGTTPLIDATVRFLEEFRSEEKEPLPTQQAARGTSREEEEREEHSAVDSFEPLYMYDAMKEKRQLKYLLVRSCHCATLRPVVSEPWRNVYRMANRETRKRSSASTSTRLKRSCSGYSLLSVAASRQLLYLELKIAMYPSQTRLTWALLCASCSSALRSVLLTYSWTRIGKFSQVAHLAHIRWKIPLNRTRAKPA